MSVNALAETINGLYKTELIKKQVRGGPSTRSRSRPPNGSTGSTTDASTSTAATSHQPRWNRLTTLKPEPGNRPSSQTIEAPDMPGFLLCCMRPLGWCSS